MASRTLVQVIVGLAAAVYLVGFFVQEVPGRAVLLHLYGLVVAVVSLVLLAFDRVLWKLPYINALVERPVLHGTWKGTFESDYEYPGTGKREGPTDAYLVARQTYSSVHVRFITARSTSESMTCELRKKGDGRHEIYAVYENRPPLLAQEESPVHRGGLILEAVGSPPRALRGSYWTDRKTRGDLKLDGHSKEVYDDFASARSGTYA